MKHLITFTIIMFAISNISSSAIYESPTIIKNVNKEKINFNPRLHLLNASGPEKRTHLEHNLKKTSLRSSLAREFSLGALENWINHLQGGNLDHITTQDFMNDLGDIRSMAKVLENYIIFKANAVTNNLALFDLKLKEIEIIDGEIKKIEGQNETGAVMKPWDERLNEVIANVSTVHSRFNVSINGICKVLKSIESFVNGFKTENILERAVAPVAPILPQPISIISDLEAKEPGQLNLSNHKNNKKNNSKKLNSNSKKNNTNNSKKLNSNSKKNNTNNSKKLNSNSKKNNNTNTSKKLNINSKKNNNKKNNSKKENSKKSNNKKNNKKQTRRRRYY